MNTFFLFFFQSIGVWPCQFWWCYWTRALVDFQLWDNQSSPHWPQAEATWPREGWGHSRMGWDRQLPVTRLTEAVSKRNMRTSVWTLTPEASLHWAALPCSPPVTFVSVRNPDFPSVVTARHVVPPFIWFNNYIDLNRFEKLSSDIK